MVFSLNDEIMKKNLLSIIAVGSIAMAGNAADWGVTGEFNGWEAMNGARMEEVSEDTYQVTLKNFQGEFKFTKDGNWQGCLGYDMISDITGNGTIHVSSPGKGNLNVPEEVEEITFVLHPDAMTLTISGLPTDMDTSIEDAPQIVEGAYYCITGPETGFFNYAESMQNVGEGMYLANNVLLHSETYLAFSKAIVNFPSGVEQPIDIKPMIKDYIIGGKSAGPDGICEVNSTVTDIVCPAEVLNSTFLIREEGYYTIFVDFNTMTITFDKFNLEEGQWSFIGEMTGWTDDIDMTKENGVWSLTLEDAQGEFKFRYNHNWEVTIGYYNENMMPVTPGDVEDFKCELNGYNFMFPEAVEKVKFDLDVTNLTLKVTVMEKTGVESVVAPSERVVYYNLQGVEVANPSKGIHIRRTGEKVEKVIL